MEGPQATTVPASSAAAAPALELMGSRQFNSWLAEQRVYRDQLWLQGLVRELYDVVVLPGVQRPSALGFKTDEIRRTITIGESP